MQNHRTTQETKYARREILATLRTVYPAAMRPNDIRGGLLAILPELTARELTLDLHYLMHKKYIEQVTPRHHLPPPIVPNEATTETEAARPSHPRTIAPPHGEQWFRLSTMGIELTDACLRDPAIDD